MTCGSIGGIPQHVNPQKWGFLPRRRWGQPYGCGRDVTAAGSAAGAAVLPTATFVPASPAGGSSRGATHARARARGSPARGGALRGRGGGRGRRAPRSRPARGAGGASGGGGGN